MTSIRIHFFSGRIQNEIFEAVRTDGYLHFYMDLVSCKMDETKSDLIFSQAVVQRSNIVQYLWRNISTNLYKQNIIRNMLKIIKRTVDVISNDPLFIN